MKKRNATLILLGALAAPAAGVALATPPDPPGALTSTLLSRGAAGEFRIDDHDTGIKLSARQATDIAIVNAKLKPGGSTGWHRHAGPSIVIVKSGSLTMDEPGHHGHGHHRGGRHGCRATTFAKGEAFVHPTHTHKFRNDSGEVADFDLVYFVPAGASPAPIDVTPAPKGCA
jgi:quercetin dioxygenase-like cupin family protein